MKLVKRYIADRPEYIVALHIDDCPIPARELEGKPYANYLDDCTSCPFKSEMGADDLPDEETREWVICPESLTDQLNQILQFSFIRRFDALKPRWSVVAIDVNTIQKQYVKVDVEVEG
jgi:hypothetical protein